MTSASPVTLSAPRVRRPAGSGRRSLASGLADVRHVTREPMPGRPPTVAWLAAPYPGSGRSRPTPPERATGQGQQAPATRVGRTRPFRADRPSPAPQKATAGLRDADAVVGDGQPSLTRGHGQVHMGAVG